MKKIIICLLLLSCSIKAADPIELANKLVACIQHSDQIGILKLLAEGANINQPNEEDTYPITAAAEIIMYADNLFPSITLVQGEIARLLLMKGANPALVPMGYFNNKEFQKIYLEIRQKFKDSIEKGEKTEFPIDIQTIQKWYDIEHNAPRSKYQKEIVDMNILLPEIANLVLQYSFSKDDEKSAC